jgi:hypothetical protein
MGTPDIPAAPPSPPPPARSTDPDVIEARRRALSEQRRKAGRGRTLLTGPLGATGSQRLGFQTLLGRPTTLGQTGGGV